MSIFISHLHTELRRALRTRRGALNENPDNVPQGLHKEYPRMKRIQLPAPHASHMSLFDTLRARASSLTGDAEPLSLGEVATLLGNALMRKKDTDRRHYPSAGALYPVETYLLAKNIEGAGPCLFHYHPTAHALEYLWEVPQEVTFNDVLVPRPKQLFPSALIVFTSVWKRSSEKYGDVSYMLALLEAGHMSENVLLTATALGLASRPMSGFNDDLLHNLLDLDTNLEQAVHVISISKQSTEARLPPSFDT